MNEKNGFLSMIMFADGEAFQNSLMIGSAHVADYSEKSHYIVGTGQPTPYQAVYMVDSETSFISYYSISGGDGVVLSQRARNNRASGYHTVSASHTNMLSDYAALDYMKNLIIGSATNAMAAMPNNGLTSEKSAAEMDAVDCIAVVVQGAQTLKITDADNNELLQDGDIIFRVNPDGTSDEIGCIWLLDADRLRYQYVLEPGTYSFDEIELDDSIPSEVMVMSFDDNQYISQTTYSDIASSEIQIEVSFGADGLTDKETMSEVLPTYIASPQEIQAINASRAQNLTVD